MTYKVIYKEFTVFVEDVEKYKQWKEGDTTVALAEVVETFDVFWSEHGPQGLLGQASNLQLVAEFGKHNDDDDDDAVVKKVDKVDVVTKILKEGRMQGAGAVASHTYTSGNASRGSDNLSRGNDNRG